MSLLHSSMVSHWKLFSFIVFWQILNEFIQSLIMILLRNKSPIWILTTIQLNAKLLCGIFTRFLLLESSNFINLLAVFIYGNHPLIQPIPWEINCLKIKKNSTLFLSFHTITTKAILERRTSFFLLEFVTTNHNNYNLASFLKVFTKPSRTVSFKTSASLKNYKSLMIKILNKK